MDIESYLRPVIDWLLTTGLRLLVILVLTTLVLWIGRNLLRRLFARMLSDEATEETRKRLDTLRSVVLSAVNVAVLVVAVVMALDELGIRIGPVLAAAGIVGVAVAFGAQQLVQDVISGFFILLEDQIRVGDVVQIAGKSGLVEKVNLRQTVLRDLSGSVHYVRNGKIDLVTNMTKDYSYWVLDIGVGYGEDVDQVTEVLHEVGRELRKDPAFAEDILEPLEIFGLDQFGDSAVMIKARLKTKPIKQWGIGREFNQRLKKKFEEKGIEIPYPNVTVRMVGGRPE
ncbi:MAG: mechanosensitive ion channel family protein [candidate division Zixibacteria bacterium]|nr:mechanosensitive ion channel family protein [candidate division Zixibacteria bacterium]